MAATRSVRPARVPRESRPAGGHAIKAKGPPAGGPKIEVMRRSPRHFLKQLLIDIEVGVNVLHIVMLFESFHQTDHRGGGRAFKLDVILRNHRDAGGCRRDASFLDSFEHGLVSGRSSEHFPTVAIIVQVVGTRFEDDAHKVVFFGGGFRYHDVTLLVKHPGDSARFGHVATVLAEHVTDFADGAVPVVGVDLSEDGDAARTVALERELFVSRAGQFAGTALDGSLDVIGGHVLALSGEDRRTQTRIAIRITTAIFGGNADFLDEASENLAALGVERALLVLNCGPL